MGQVLKREETPEDYLKKEKKLQGKRTKDYVKVPYFIAICMKRQVPAPPPCCKLKGCSWKTCGSVRKDYRCLRRACRLS